MAFGGSSMSSGFVIRFGDAWYHRGTHDTRCRPVDASTIRDLVSRVSDRQEADTAPLPSTWVGTLHEDGIRVTTERGGRWVSEADLTTPSLTNLNPVPGARATPRPPLRNPVHAATLLRRGWVTFPLLDAHQVNALRAGYGDIHGWEGEGFEPDVGSSDAPYRRRTSELISQVIDAAGTTVFDDFEPFLRGFYCKWPGTPESDLHWDWSSVDERLGHRAYLMWVALQDTTQKNGQMAVLSRSHLIDNRPRGTHLSLPMSSEFAAREPQAHARVTSVPMRAGEALVFDMGLLHISSPNVTEEPRLAAVTGWHPSGVSLSYYRRLDDRAALRYEVDAAWFNSMVPLRLMDEEPPMVPVEVVPLGDGDFDARVDAFLEDGGLRPEPAGGKRLGPMLEALRPIRSLVRARRHASR